MQDIVTVNCLLLDRDILHDAPYPIQFLRENYETNAIHRRGLFGRMISDELGVDVEERTIKLWKPREPMPVEAPFKEGWPNDIIQDFHRHLSTIPLTRSLSDSLGGTTSNQDLIHVLITISDIYCRRLALPTPVPVLEIWHRPMFEAGCYEGGPGTEQGAEERHSCDIITDSIYRDPSFLLLGLRMVDSTAFSGSVIRLLSYADNIKPTHFRAHIDAWGGTKMIKTSLSWLRMSQSPLLQSGSVDADHYQIHLSTGLDTLTERIPFDEPYNMPPMVFISLSGLRLAMTKAGKYANVRAFATNIDSRGFTLNILMSPQGESDVKLGNTQVHWFAFPEHGLPGLQICMGHFAVDSAASKVVGGSVEFERPFQTEPSVFIALNHIHADRGKYLRIRADVSNITTTGLDWELGTWLHSLLHSASASFIAIGN